MSATAVDPPDAPPPLRLRRLAALTAAVRATGYAGVIDYDRASGVVRLTPADAAAQAVIDGWDWTDATDADAQVRKQAAAALAANADYLKLTGPDAAAVAAQVKALTRQVQHVIRRVLQLSEGA